MYLSDIHLFLVPFSDTTSGFGSVTTTESHEEAMDVATSVSSGEVFISR